MDRTIELPKVPNVIFSQKYYRKYDRSFLSSKRYQNAPQKYDARIKESNFFFGLDGSITKYMSRNSAIDKRPLEDEQGLRKAGVDEKKILGYMKERPGSTGLFDADGAISEEKAKEIQDFLRTTPQMGWSCVMSFLPEYSDELASNPYEAQKILKTMVPKQLEAQGLDPKDFYWFGAYHTNTDNRHMHYVIVPKSADLKVKALTDREIIKNMPKMVERDFPMKNYHFPLDRDYFLEEYSKKFEEASPRLCYDAFNVLNRKKQYARLTKEERKIVNSITWKVLNTDKTLKKGLETLKSWADEQQMRNITHKEATKVPVTEEDTQFAQATYYAFMNRVYNKTLKLMNSGDDGKVSSFKEDHAELTKFTSRKALHKYTSQDKYAIGRASAMRRANRAQRRRHENIADFMNRLIRASANYAIEGVNASFAQLWRELTEEQKEALRRMQMEERGDYAEGPDNEVEFG